jgi:hypothetical protein
MNETPPPCAPGDNPFRSERIDGLPFRPQDCTWQELLHRLEALHWRAAVVGPEGSGKTTLLDDLAVRSPGTAARVVLRGETVRPYATARSQLPDRITPEHVVLVDGAERIGPLAWRRLTRATRRAGGLVITAHTPGKLPTLVECQTSHPLLRDLVQELAPDDFEKLDPLLEELYHRHAGNVRLCLLELYDLYAGRR